MATREGIRGLIKLPPVSEGIIRESEIDFKKNFKPLFEQMEEWRRCQRAKS